MAVHSVSSLPLFPSHPKLTNSVTSNSLYSIRFPQKTIITRHIRSQTVTATMSVDAYAVGEDLPADYADWLPKVDPGDKRRAGVLLHPTSFPGPYGIGDLGDQAFRFIDWLHEAGCSLWQVLPLVPPGRKANEEGSPYSGQDANCGNTLLISLDDLVKDGLLMKEELPEPLDTDRVNYETVADLKDPLIAKIDIFVAQQFLFQRQWKRVCHYARMKGVSIMGDMPIYVGYHSADVWANKKSFLLNRKGFPLLVSGVPPDAFSETGQLWDSPLYDWKAMEEDQFSWWVRRLQRAQDLFDEFRIDHFRGFSGFWAVPSEAKIATLGRWKVGPGSSLFNAIFRAVGKINIIAEDLGVITEDVVQLRKSIGAPGMAVLQFGFGSDSANPHLPHNHEQNQVVYTGTHDNDTIRGWWDVLQQEEQCNVLNYLSISADDDISWALIRAALSSVAQTSIIPMQDILGLGSSARMNIPATQSGNWSWRIPNSMSFSSMEPEAKKLRDMLSMYGRL
ncbi:4-alpha-glucanotransferase, chloroplastic/amyloplastic isoform X2 [Cynara cardunculus var. scolymus]|uniref:4-alpha-glucanotransferase, chloroplastic/amyloplastic isoform X2 n=1 Tax=Cynara cardunculus var. scolymus TaxID=59895 RepID=UPI000D628E1A|nr:4-alpha-glucanotransferase, chloroplastic/amyloplastic isoform X2 [Cynara cardunculus var. scolymus]